MRIAIHSAWCLLLMFGTGAVHAQTPPHGHAHHDRADTPLVDDPAAIEAFVSAARAATERYHDRAAAIADGFRLLGPDFPAMGEHWVHPGRMVNGTLDVARPQALSYAMIHGGPVLTGVIYAKPLHGDEAPPDFPVPGYPWHDHVGAIDEESVLLHHVPSGDAAGSGVRLAMLHAWVWTNNPDGVFAPDNWALPFLRLELDVPPRIPVAAARALSLNSGDGYYRMLFRALALPTPSEEKAAQDRIRHARDRVERWHAARPPGESRVEERDLAWLAQLWTDLWTDVASAVQPGVASRLELLLSH